MTHWCSHNKITLKCVSKNVSPWLSDTALYLKSLLSEHSVHSSSRGSLCFNSYCKVIYSKEDQIPLSSDTLVSQGREEGINMYFFLMNMKFTELKYNLLAWQGVLSRRGPVVLRSLFCFFQNSLERHDASSCRRETPPKRLEPHPKESIRGQWEEGPPLFIQWFRASTEINCLDFLYPLSSHYIPKSSR